MRSGIPFRGASTCALLVAALTAPALVAGGAALPAQSGGRRPLDGVVGVIGDRVILASTIERELEKQGYGAEPDAALRKRAQEDILREIAREEVWVQIGKVIGREDPQAFEGQIRRLLDEYKLEQVEKYGSFTRMNQELEALETTWQSVENDQRNRILADSARQHAISQRFSEGLHLLVTPREMLRFYQENPEQFAARESADLAWVSFPKSEPGAAEKAAEAAGVWRVESVSERDLATRFDGIALRPNLDVRQTADDPRAAFLKEFARSGAEGDVLGPLERGNAWFVVKIVRKMSQPELEFESPDVQAAIRRMLVQTRLQSIELEVLNLKARQIVRIPPWILSTR